MPAVNKSSQKPPSVMTWMKAAPVLVVAGIFDAARCFFLSFWFFGPALAAMYCTSKLNSLIETNIAVTGGKIVATACVSGAAAGGAVSAPALIAFGTIMAISVGFAGWFIVTFFIAATNSRALGENPFAVLWLFEGLGASVFIMAWGIYRTQIKKEKEMMKKYQKETAVARQQEQNQQTAYLMQAQAAQMEQAEIY